MSRALGRCLLSALGLSAAMLLALYGFRNARPSGPRAVGNAPDPAPTTQPSPDPSPKLTPEDVVRIQMEALRTNDAADAGIATAFKFASPGNKQMTGPVERFGRMVRTPAYALMLNCRSVAYVKPQIDGDHARQLVKVVGGGGETVYYLFILTKQGDGEYKDCWMTDGVTPGDVAGDDDGGLTV